VTSNAILIISHSAFEPNIFIDYLNKKVFACQPYRFQAKKLEPWVWDNVISALTDPQVAESVINEAHAIHQNQGAVAESDRLRQKICGIDDQIAALAEHLTQIPKGMSPAPIFTQMQRLESLKKEILISGDVTDIPAGLRDYNKFCELVRSFVFGDMSDEMKSRIVKLLVHKIEVFPESYRLHFYAGRDYLKLIQENGSKDSVCGSDQKEEGPGVLSP